MDTALFTPEEGRYLGPKFGKFDTTQDCRLNGQLTAGQRYSRCRRKRGTPRRRVAQGLNGSENRGRDRAEGSLPTVKWITTMVDLDRNAFA